MEGLCTRCLRKPFWPIPRAYVFDPESPARYLGLDAVEAMAGFACIQWIRLEKEIPDAVIPMPDPDSIAIARALAEAFDCPFIPAVSFDGKLKEDRLEEDLVLLLFDVLNRKERLCEAALSLSDSFPKRIYLFSLIPDVECK